MITRENLDLELLVGRLARREVVVVSGADAHVAFGAAAAHVKFGLHATVGVGDLVGVAEVAVGAFGAQPDEDAEAPTDGGPQELVEVLLALLGLQIGFAG